jgi:hypothetical protein
MRELPGVIRDTNDLRCLRQIITESFTHVTEIEISILADNSLLSGIQILPDSVA